MKIRFDLIGRLLKVSIGGMGQYLIGTASWLFMVRIISMFGSDAIAGYTLSMRIVMFTILPAWGLSNAAATLVGQNLGAKKPERAEQSVWLCAHYNMVFLLALSVMFFFIADDIVSIFIDNAVVSAYAVSSLKYVTAGYIFFAYGMVLSQAFNGAGDTRTPTIINFFGYWMFQLPLAYLLAVNFNMGPDGVFLAIAISIGVLASIFVISFRKGRWKLVNI